MATREELHKLIDSMPEEATKPHTECCQTFKFGLRHQPG